MNIQELDILKTIYVSRITNQRIIADQSGYSLGTVNKSIKKLIDSGYINDDIQPTSKALNEMHAKSPTNAIILAAGFGMRMVPINLETPKALVEVDGEKLIERQIRQLHEVGIQDITIVVGFMKESFEYLVDEFGVKLIVNSDYAQKNNIYSLGKVIDSVSNTYIIPCDIWCESNPFDKFELYSWYMVSDLVDDFSMVRVNRKLELVKTNDSKPGNEMIGIAYLSNDPVTDDFKKRVKQLISSDKNKNLFWEEALFDKEKFIVNARVVPSVQFVEINTYEQLRELDSKSSNLNNAAINTAAEALGVNEVEITQIRVLKKGMTNRSFKFKTRGIDYIMRVPGEGTDKLIDRKNEAIVYGAISGLGICDDPVYISQSNGFKLTRYLDGVRTCDPDSEVDLVRCMTKLRDFHNKKLIVPNKFDILEQIEFYESLWNGSDSVYSDYLETKKNTLSLMGYIEHQKRDYCLTHIDAVPDNFLFYKDEDGKEKLQLIDWEYAGMQDPHVDVAMFCIYSLYDREKVDKLIDIYFENNCPYDTRVKIYCYISLCGLLWSNWCEYKRALGVEFGEYSLRQYRYAKEYYRIANKMMAAKEEIEQHQATRAIIMAAGEGIRLRPITLETPKPLIRVNGVRMIDTVIEALQENGIQDIYIVVGYLKEKFKALTEQYKGIHIIENPYYKKCNNISSLYVARYYLGDCIILDGDQLVFNKEILNSRFYRSGYSAVWTEEHTDEWLMQVENGVVKSCSRNGGEKGWQLYSVSRWTKEDGEKLKKHLELEFEMNHNDQIYWDDIPMFVHQNEYQLGIYAMDEGDIVEIDNLDELIELDESYVKNK